MVRPAAPVVTTPTSSPPSAGGKLNHLNNLSSGFQSLLAGALAPKLGGIGLLAGHAKPSARVPFEARQTRLPAKAPRPDHAHADDAELELDPLARSLAVPHGLAASCAPPPAASALREVPDARELEDAVRRIAWGGDRRRGVARLELGGSYEGTVVTVRGEGREVALRVEMRPGTDAAHLPERLAERLKARGLTVTDIEVA